MWFSRRKFLSTMGFGAVAAGVTGSSVQHAAHAAGTCSFGADCIDETDPAQKNTLFDQLEGCCTGEPLADDEMRITFLGTSCVPRLSQQGVSVYVEVGPTHKVKGWEVPADYAMFDCGMGVLANYIAMDIPYSRMDKIFLTHLHADHMSELSAIYCFGEANDRKSPLYVWGPSKSGVRDPYSHQIHDDGTKACLEHLREWARWHSESFSFTFNGFESYEPPTKESWGLPVDPVPVGPQYRENGKGEPIGGRYADPPNDSYALVPIELEWQKIGGVAYDNALTGLKITHFPIIHCRKGSIGYKLEWTPLNHPERRLSMIYSGDTRPNYTMIDQASGIDVLVHEIVMPADAWARKFLRIPEGVPIPQGALNYLTDVQNSSHTTQAAFGYMLSQIQPPPRLTIATHFQAADDTIMSARETIYKYLLRYYDTEADCPPFTFAADFMVFNVTKDEITQRRAEVSRFAYAAPTAPNPQDPTIPKYHKVDEHGEIAGDPYAQIANEDWIPYGDDTYDQDGY